MPMPNTPTGAPPGKPNGTGVDKNVANGAVDDNTDYNDDSDEYDKFRNNKKEKEEGSAEEEGDNEEEERAGDYDDHATQQ